jgi:hypothetical protein
VPLAKPLSWALGEGIQPTLRFLPEGSVLFLLSFDGHTSGFNANTVGPDHADRCADSFRIGSLAQIREQLAQACIVEFDMRGPQIVNLKWKRISGSLYVLTMTLLLWRRASRTSSAGVMRIGPTAAAGSRRACEVTQFWQ